MRTWSLRLLRQLFRLRLSALHVVAAATSVAFKSRTALQLENLALRHQLGVLRRSAKQPKLTSADRLLVDVAVRILTVCAGRLLPQMGFAVSTISMARSSGISTHA